MTYEEVLKAVSVTAEYVASRKGSFDKLLAALLSYAAFIGISAVKNGTDVDEFLGLCRAAFESELRRIQKKGN